MPDANACGGPAADADTGQLLAALFSSGGPILYRLTRPT